MRDLPDCYDSMCPGGYRFLECFAAPLQGVVAVGASIYIAVYTLKNIASFSQQDSSAYLSNDKTGIIPLCVKVAAVVWLLSNQAFLYNNLIGPVIGAGMAIGQQIAPGGLGAGSFSGTSDVNALFNAVINKVQEFNDQVYIVVALAVCCYVWLFSLTALLTGTGL